MLTAPAPNETLQSYTVGCRLLNGGVMAVGRVCNTSRAHVRTLHPCLTKSSIDITEVACSSYNNVLVGGGEDWPANRIIFKSGRCPGLTDGTRGKPLAKDTVIIHCSFI